MGSVIASCSGSDRQSEGRDLLSKSSRCVASLASKSCKSKKTAKLTADAIDEHVIASLGNEEITSVWKVSTRLGAFRQEGAEGHLLSRTETRLFFLGHVCSCSLFGFHKGPYI